MFTGIVVERGIVRKRQRRATLHELEIESRAIAHDLAKGDSVAVNGVCLTAVAIGRKRFSVELMEETLVNSTLGELHKGATVNLELPVRVGDRLGGHIVQGHVDGVAELVRLEEGDGWRRVWCNAGDDLLRYLVPKGSVTLDGVSLTVVEVGRTTFQVALIPHTLSHTTLGEATVGTKVNVEVDVLAKYVERLHANVR